jgi:lipid II:glycine glycyltransferase (peptidoglycan interpeptide bridge formation enzyme)
MTARKRQWEFLEMRGGEALVRDVSPSTCYDRHVLALHGNVDKVFSGLRSNYRAKIRKASEHNLRVEMLHSPEAMAAYYQLHCLTRRRHGLMPQPAYFFKKIQAHLIAKDLGFVTLVTHKGRAVAGAVFFTFGQQALYKFGASDLRWQHLYPNYLLFWHVIQWLCQQHYTELCFGRTSLENQGLRQFKAGWGTQKSRIHYYKYDLKTASFLPPSHSSTDSGSRLCQKMSLTLLQLAGSVVYRHLG